MLPRPLFLLLLLALSPASTLAAAASTLSSCAAALQNITITTTPDSINGINSRIVGGDYLTDAEYQNNSYTVALVSEYKEGYYAQFCGGTLIDSRFVLTAAHCIANMEGKQLFAVIGRRVLTESDKGEIIPVERSFVHDTYDPDSVLSTGDIAISRLLHPVTLSESEIKPLKVITPLLALQVLPQMMASIYGYGRQQPGVSGPLTDDRVQASGSNKLARVDVPLVDNAICNAAYELLTNRFEIFPSQLCAGWEEGGKSSCQGDSGGPLVVEMEGESYQIGLVSWAQGCASPHFPTVFTRLSSYLDWISDKTTLIQTSLYQGDGAEDNILYTGETGNYIFTGVGRSSTLYLNFENLSPVLFVLTVGVFSSLDLIGKFNVSEESFQLAERGSKMRWPLVYVCDDESESESEKEGGKEKEKKEEDKKTRGGMDFVTVRLNLVTALTPSQESFAVLTGVALPKANFTERKAAVGEGGDAHTHTGGLVHVRKEEEEWYTSEGTAGWTRRKDEATNKTTNTNTDTQTHPSSPSSSSSSPTYIYTSGPINNSEESCLLTYLQGAGTLSFDWRVSCEDTYDYLMLFIDNIPIESISGESSNSKTDTHTHTHPEGGWERKEFSIVNNGEGEEEEEHIITFCFFKDRAVSVGEDGGEVRGFRFVPAGGEKKEKEEGQGKPHLRRRRQ